MAAFLSIFTRRAANPNHSPIQTLKDMLHDAEDMGINHYAVNAAKADRTQKALRDAGLPEYGFNGDYYRRNAEQCAQAATALRWAISELEKP